MLHAAARYYRSLNNYQYQFEVHLRYHILYFYKEYGTNNIGKYLGPYIT